MLAAKAASSSIYPVFVSVNGSLGVALNALFTAVSAMLKVQCEMRFMLSRIEHIPQTSSALLCGPMKALEVISTSSFSSFWRCFMIATAASTFLLKNASTDFT